MHMHLDAMGNMRVYYYRKRISLAAAAADMRRAIEHGNYDAVKRTITRNRHLVHFPSGWAADHPVHVAARAGHQRIVTMLLHRGADPNARNAHRKTPMHLCVLHCQHKMVELLIGCGADLGAVDGSNNTPLELATLMNEKQCLDVLLNCDTPRTVINRAFYKAAMIGNTILMNKLLNRGADIEYKDETMEFTALLVAMKYKHVRVAQFLLEKGANPMVHDTLRWTCLHYAVYFDYPIGIVMMILKNCHVAKILIEFRTRKRETALHLAAKRGNKMAAFVLLRAGACSDAIDCRSRTPLLTAMLWGKDAVASCIIHEDAAAVNRVPGSEQAPLHAAVVSNNLQMARFILEHGALVVDPRNDDFNWTVIHMACQSGDMDMLLCLLAYTEPSVLKDLHDCGRPKPPLIVAASMGYGDVVDALLSRGVDVNAQCGNGETALHAAVRANKTALVDRLLNAGACIDARDSVTGLRPLDVAVYTWGRQVMVTAQLVHSDRLAKAVVRHDVDAVMFLLACGVSPNMTTVAYGSPLHAAVRHRQYRMVAVLLSSNWCRTAIRYNGVTPLDYAVAMGDERAVRMLLWPDYNRRRRRTRHLSLRPTMVACNDWGSRQTTHKMTADTVVVRRTSI